MTQNTTSNWPSTDLDSEELCKTDLARGITLAMIENGAFSTYDWFGGINTCLWDEGRIEVLYAEDEEEPRATKWLTCADILAAARKIGEGRTRINRAIRSNVNDALAGDLGTIDADGLDSIAQVAVFDDIIFG